MTFNHERRLRRIAEELLADERIAGVLTLFDELPATHHREWPRRRRSRRATAGLIALTVLLGGAMAASLIAASVTGAPVFAVGLVLMVPAFLVFGHTWQDRTDGGFAFG